MNIKTKRADIAADTLEILKNGFYINPEGDKVFIKTDHEKAVSRTVLFKPLRFDEVFKQRDFIMISKERLQTSFEVTVETTLACAYRLCSEDTSQSIALLNFASAKNPGGGFLGGSQAQEESIARSSSLYHCLSVHQAMYIANRNERSCLYTDHMIYAPAVPVFKDDEGNTLHNFYKVNMITAPAVNKGAILANEPQNIIHVQPVMLSRIEKILSIAVVNKIDTLILGAWGCGVFRNDLVEIAKLFARQLIDNPLYAKAFRKVVFAIPDNEDRKIAGPFERQFSS